MSQKILRAIREWKEDVDGIPAKEIRRALHFCFHPAGICKDAWYREQGFSYSLVRRKGREMWEHVPPDYETGKNPWFPKYPQPASPYCKICHGTADIYTDCECKHYPPANPDCKECRGTGCFDYRVPNSLYTELISCTCKGGPGREGMRKRRAEYEAALAAKGVTASPTGPPQGAQRDDCRGGEDEP